ncbi:tyrosine-type recombinase/integrase [Nostoc edaphicum CCNP1411]|uniref:Tyrosine-type recombinase/integrase n=1 Tax=Nostoc edaphicum CCNP1411 TaxID=1472755 RepID=A0A7D7QQJ9_9NOSO|nr:site-specific integrase [Nostoc edaphicum]QMS91345.1 tyrosine-type recombinase/integrase [Nostoc edaphicum CCNP1411]
MSQDKAQPADVNCPYCESSETIKRGSPQERKHGVVQPCLCKECGRRFTLGGKQAQAQPADVNCPYCESSETIKSGKPIERKHGVVQLCLCKECGRRFTLGSKQAQPAGVNCPHCESSETIKNGKPLERKYSVVQLCLCKECNRRFTLGGRKRRTISHEGKVIYSYWDDSELLIIDNVSCPNCKQNEVVLKTEYYDNKRHKQTKRMICLSCSQEFTGEGKDWSNSTKRKLGKTIPLEPWEFEKDRWDLRVLYPGIEEYKLKSLFLNFTNCGSNWFVNLIKTYVIWRINSGIKGKTVFAELHNYRHFGWFLERQGVTCIEEIDRNLLATYYNKELCHLANSTFINFISRLSTFFNWGNETQNFITPSTLISSFDYPKIFNEEPDPLEDSVIEAIIENLHILPESLQLMFMLGFHLGARPGELCYLRKDCCKPDQDGTIWWVEFEREKSSDEHRLPVPTEIVHLIKKQKTYINELFGDDYPYLFCHYQQLGITGYPNYPQMKAIKRPPMVAAFDNPMVKVIRFLIEKCKILDSNGKLANFTGAILRPSQATQLINTGYSLNFVRSWLKHRSERTTRRHYTRYKAGQLLDVASVMANLDQKYYSYDSNPESLNPESLRQNSKLHELDGLTMLSGEPLYGYCSFREFCPRFGKCYTCGYHIASADKLFYYKSQLERLKIKEEIAFSHGSSEIYQSYQQIVNALESIIDALEGADEQGKEATNSPELG